MSQKLNSEIAVIGIDIGKNAFHLVGLDKRGAKVVARPGGSAAGQPFALPDRDVPADIAALGKRKALVRWAADVGQRLFPM